ncbi:MAG: hypothetical protein AAF604_06925 [Acidobacteriota bacterium]
MRKIWTCLIVLILLASGSAYAAEKCESRAYDDTAIGLAEMLARYDVAPTAQPMVRYSNASGTIAKESSQPFVIRDKDGWAIGGGTLSCTGKCTGSWCGVTGCDPENGGCSGCSCTGNCSSTCTCTKKVTVEMAPAPGPVTPDIPRSPRF